MERAVHSLMTRARRGRIRVAAVSLAVLTLSAVALATFALASASSRGAGSSGAAGGSAPASASAPLVAATPAGSVPAPAAAGSAEAPAGCNVEDATAAYSAGRVPSAVPLRHDGAVPAPPVTARAAVAIDAETGQVLYGLNHHERRPPASTTKIMTAILALETVDQQAWTVSGTDARKMPGSSVMGLRPGVYITMHDLLYGLMLPSGNDAALEIAKNVDGTVDAFVRRMNDKVAQLGLRDTHFDNPHGLDTRQHYSSAYDLAMLGRYAMGNEAFRAIAATQTHHLAPPSDYALRNGNTLLNKYAGAEGIKIGWTNRAGWTFVASAVRDGRRVIVALLQSDDRDGDAAALLDWAYASHSWAAISPETARTLQMGVQTGETAPAPKHRSSCG